MVGGKYVWRASDEDQEPGFRVWEVGQGMANEHLELIGENILRHEHQVILSALVWIIVMLKGRNSEAYESIFGFHVARIMIQ